MAALVDDVIPELKHLLDTLMRRSPTWEVEQIRVHARLLARAAQDLAAMHGAYDPPPAMTFPESLENWADPALERIAVRKSGRPAAWD